MTHTETLYNYLLEGHRISDHNGWTLIKVPNIRSRVCSIEKKYGIKVSRKRVEGKAYNEYWIEAPKPVECPEIVKPFDFREIVNIAGQISMGL